MPVIINDLEVILENRREAADDGAPASTAPAPPDTAIAPITLDRVEVHRRARAARLRAH
jgi:hypothetical protein